MGGFVRLRFYLLRGVCLCTCFNARAERLGVPSCSYSHGWARHHACADPNKSSFLTTLSVSAPFKQMHCDQSEQHRPQLRVWTYLASVSKELQPFKSLLHAHWITSTKHHGIGFDTVNMEPCCTHSLNQGCQRYNEVSISKWHEDDDGGGYRDYADTPN